MPISQDFNYARPSTLDEVLDLLERYGKNAAILAGGTDMANMLKQGFPVPEMMIDIKALEELSQISLDGSKLHIGALVTFSEIIKSEIIREHMKVLWEAAHLVASAGIRNRATVAGNICSAVACMDSAAPLLVHDASIHLASRQGERRLPVHKYFVDNRKTARRENELLTKVSIELPLQKYAGCYQKLMRYAGEDLAQANVGVLALEDGSFRVAFGAVGPIPKRSAKIERFLHGNQITGDVLAEAKAMVASVISPITDIRASKEYRTFMTMHMLEEGIKKALGRLGKKLPSEKFHQ
jgi:CO/xanthine dehydrogenase FAD-binding subunit